MSRLEKKNKNQLLLFDLNPPISIPTNKKTDCGKEGEGFIYIVEDKRREEIKVGFTNCIERRVNKELPRDRVRLTRLARMQVPTLDMELHFHDWLHKMGINSVGSGRSEWYPSKNKGKILRYFYRLPDRYLKKGKLSAEKMAIMQNLIDNNYFDIEYFETDEKRSDVLVAQKTKKEMLRDASHVMRALSSSALKHEIKEEVKRLKEEKLRGSCTYEEVAEEFGIYPRSLREYVSGRKKPGLGQPATRYGFLLEKYYLNKELNRWFVRDDYDWRNELNA